MCSSYLTLFSSEIEIKEADLSWAIFIGISCFWTSFFCSNSQIPSQGAHSRYRWLWHELSYNCRLKELWSVECEEVMSYGANNEWFRDTGELRWCEGQQRRVLLMYPYSKSFLFCNSAHRFSNVRKLVIISVSCCQKPLQNSHVNNALDPVGM